ncbi:MAG: hypothetical protein PVG24_14465 [Gammaproteobacteria bacterium]
MQISLVREHTEKINPSRALWVPFELGRPVGAPGEPDFQRRVLEAALGLFGADSGPVLEDFPEDAPGGASDDYSGWVCPVNLAPPPAPDEAGDAAAVLAEIEKLRPWYQIAREQRGRTTVGVSGLAVEDAARLLAGFLADPGIDSPRADLALPQALKFAAEDLKAWYLEAATAKPGPSASKALNDWFWRETAAGALVLRVAAACRQSDVAALNALGQRSLVPRAYWPLIG